MVSETEPRGLSETGLPGESGELWGAALLVTGSRLVGVPAESVAGAFAELGELLHAGRDRWLLRRLSPAAGEWLAPSRAGIKHHLADLGRRCDAGGALVVVIAGVIVDGKDGPALVTGAHHDVDPAGATLPLAAMRDVIVGGCVAPVVVVMAGWPEGHVHAGAAAWAEALHTGRDADLIVAGDDRRGAEILQALGAGLAGEAVDPASGTVTSSSLADHLRRAVPAATVRAPAARRTIARPTASALLDGLVAPRRRSAADDDDDLTGTTLPGELRLEEKIAHGAFGAVYRAWHLGLGRRVAVKILRSGHQPDSEEARLFAQEIRAIAQIKHPNVVYVHHAGVTLAGQLFFEMELLDGVTVQQLVERDGLLPRPRAIDLTCQLLRGLSAAHEAGLIHADVKPSNTMVVDDGGRDRVVLIDFGLARLRLPDGPAESAGGTRSYMAPEQFGDGRVDARSDLYAAALVMVRMLTGWQRATSGPQSPTLADLDDPALRAALGRALAEQPADRFATAGEMLAALGAGGLPSAAPPPPPPPFRHLQSFTEGDRGRLHGRDRDIVKLARALDGARVVVLTAPSGTGKTSVLRAGLVPYFEARGTRALYWPCHGDAADLARAISPGVDDLPAAIDRWHVESHGRRLVLVLDQVERLLGPATDGAASVDGTPAASPLLDAVLAFERLDPDAAVAVLLSVREDFHARLFAAAPRLARGHQPVRLPPLDRDQARLAIERPLTEHRLTIAPDLLDRLLDDLVAAGIRVGADLGWDVKAPVYPPHLQLACSVLYEQLGPTEAKLTLAHYERLHGFDAIVGEHLQREMDMLSANDRVVAKELLLSLITSAGTKLTRAEDDLFAVLGSFPAARIAAVLEILRERVLVVPVAGRGGERTWELVHESLVTAIESFEASQDLDRRRVADVIRYHLRQSEKVVSLLNPAQLAALAPYPTLLADLDREWSRRPGVTMTPSELVDRSRRAIAYRRSLLAGVAAAIVIVLALLVYNWWSERERRRAAAVLSDRDLGRITLELQPFDWDPATLTATSIDAALLPDLTWTLHEPDADDPDSPGPAIPPSRLEPGPRRLAAGALVQDVEVRSGDAVLVIANRHRRGESPCADSILPLHKLPGYAQRSRSKPIPVRIPTCAATLVDTILIPAGPFISGGTGDPAPHYPASEFPPEVQVTLAPYRIDRTEITNGAFQIFADMHELTGMFILGYPSQYEYATAASYPRTDIDARDAQVYCRYLGKDLPTSDQWQKALRGGLRLADGSANAFPRRNFPWGAPRDPPPANLADTGTTKPAPVGTYVDDRSPYEVLDLAGNVQEWTATLAPGADAVLPGHPTSSFHVTRGGNWWQTRKEDLVDFMASDNPRSPRQVNYFQGARCVSKVMTSGASEATTR